MKRKIIIVVAAVLLLFLALPLAGGYWILYTDSGFRFVVAQLRHLQTIVRIEATGAGGNLADGVHIQHLSIRHERVAITIDDLKFRLQPQALLLQTVQAESASLGKARVELLPRIHPPGTAPLKFLPSFLRLVSNDAAISEADVILENHYQINARAIRGNILLTSHHLAVTSASLDGGFFTAAGTFDLGAADPITLSGDMRWTLRAQDREPWRGTLRMAGDLNDLGIHAEQTFPIQAKIEARALTLTHAWHWESVLSSSFIDFAKLNPGAKVSVSDLALALKGDHSGISVEGVLTPVSIPTGKLKVSMKGPYPTRRVQLDALTLEAAGGTRVDARGVLNFIDGGPVIELRGTAGNFRWPLLQEGLVNAKSLNFSLDGPHLPYRFIVDGRAILQKLPPFDVKASGLIDHDHMILSPSSAGWLDGHVQVDGELGWTGTNAWNFSLTGQDLNPATIDPAWPGRLNIVASVAGRGLSNRADIDLSITRVNGKLRGEGLNAQGRVQRRGDNILFNHVSARFADAHAEVDGKFGNPRDVHMNLDAPHLGRVFPGLKGAMTVQGHLSGPPTVARLTGTVTARGLKFGTLEAQSIQGTTDLDLSDRLASHLDLKAGGVAIDAHSFGNVEALLDGRASDHRFTFSSLGGLMDIRGSVTGSYNPKGWRGTITALTLHNGDDVDVHLEAPAGLRWSQDAAALESLCMLGVNERACAQGDWQRGGPWNLKANGAGIPLRALGANLPTKPEYMGSLSFDTEAHGRSLDDAIGHLSVDLSEGNLRYKLPSGNEETLHLGSGHAELVATAANLDAKLHLAATEQSFLDVKLNGARSASQGIFKPPSPARFTRRRMNWVSSRCWSIRSIAPSVS